MKEEEKSAERNDDIAIKKQIVMKDFNKRPGVLGTEESFIKDGKDQGWNEKEGVTDLNRSLEKMVDMDEGWRMKEEVKIAERNDDIAIKKQIVMKDFNKR